MFIFQVNQLFNVIRGRHGRDGMVIGFKTAISVYHHLSCEFLPRSWRDVLDTSLCDTCDRSVVFPGYSGLLHQ
jgi:hypothetical protein